MFENQIKSLIRHCKHSELHLYFEWTTVDLKMPKKWSILASFWKSGAWGQTVIPDTSFTVLAPSINFCPTKSNLSGNTIGPQTSDFQIFWHFYFTLRCSPNDDETTDRHPFVVHGIPSKMVDAWWAQSMCKKSKESFLVSFICGSSWQTSRGLSLELRTDGKSEKLRESYNGIPSKALTHNHLC